MSDDVYIPEGASEREQRIRRHVHAQAEFFRHLAIYVCVITLLWVINLMQSGWPSANSDLFRYWAIWPTLGWGIGIVIHGLSTVSRVGLLSQDWEERKVREMMQRDGGR